MKTVDYMDILCGITYLLKTHSFSLLCNREMVAASGPGGSTTQSEGLGGPSREATS